MKPISLIPSTPEKALSAFMSVDPIKVEDRLRREGVKKDKK
jgi:hypothetical protein